MAERGEEDVDSSIPQVVDSADPVEATVKEEPIVNALTLPKLKKPVQKTNIPIGSVLRDRWSLKGMIGQGGYGEIYFAVDLKAGEEVAVKVEPTHRRGKVARRMILEQRVLQRLQGRPHSPKMYASGVENASKTSVNFIVMQLLSINIGDLKKTSPYKRLSKSTVGRILIQGIAGLRDIHQIGYIHRDIKPANMCFGITPYSRHRLLIVDYGLVRRFRYDDGTPRKIRRRAGFRGTLRYVSIRVHDRMDQAPADDLVSLLYSGLELLIGDLPWKYMLKNADIRRAKTDIHFQDLACLLDVVGHTFQDFSRAIYSIHQDEEPNYGALQLLVTEMIGNRTLSDPYDWENDYADVLDLNN